MAGLRPILLVSLALFLSACGYEREREPRGVALTWIPPAQFDDGRALSPEDLTEYRIYVDDEVVATVEPDQTEYFLELPPGEWEVSISAVAAGVESRHAEAARVTIP